MELYIKSLIMGVVEGLTEFLPISSTGHLIITGDLLKFLDKDHRDVFEIVIQFGAILAVCWEYRRRLIPVLTEFHKDVPARRLAINLAVAFIPAAVLGLLFGGGIKAHLFSPVPVALAFIVGGLIIFAVERKQRPARISEVDDLTWKDALKVGFAQCLALIPGTSRSGATIIGGMIFGLSRKTAAEFSFFLAIPTLGAATAYDLLKHRSMLDAQMTGLLAAGFFMSFICALLAVRGLIRYISRHDFTVFAWYRIAFGLIVLITAYLHMVSWSH